MSYVCDCGVDGANTVLGACPEVDLVRPAFCEYTTYSRDDLLMFAENFTSGTVVYVFAWGAAAVLSLFVIGFAVGAIKRLLNLA